MVLKKKLTIYLIFVLSVFLGFYFSENASGGAKIDYKYLLPFIKKFSIDFESGLELFTSNRASLIHSPAFYIINGFFLKITGDIFLVKIFYILVSCSLPYVFYLILKKKYQVENDYIFYFSLIIFFSPYFRGSAIWLLGDNLSLLFLSLSILFFLKTNDEKDKISNYYFCFIFLILCFYIRYYYCLFGIYFLFHFYKNLKSYDFFKILIFSFILLIPAFYYLLHIIINANYFNVLGTFGYVNFYSTGLLILSIILFYLLPFIYVNRNQLINFYKEKPIKILLFLVPILLIYLIDEYFFLNLINFSPRGGGVFVKLSEIINLNSNLFLSIVALISLLVIDFIFNGKRLENYSLLIILILCFPLFTIYQKYFDPLFYLFFFGLVNSIYIKKIITKSTVPILLIYSYFSLFLIFAISYYVGI